MGKRLLRNNDEVSEASFSNIASRTRSKSRSRKEATIAGGVPGPNAPRKRRRTAEVPGLSRINNEDTDSEEIERIDEKEFRAGLRKGNNNDQQEVDDGNSRGNSRENVTIIEYSSNDSGCDEDNGNDEEDVDEAEFAEKIDRNRKEKALSAYSRKKKNKEQWHINLGIASRTRSKTGITKWAPEVDYADSSDDSDSSSTDTGFDSSDELYDSDNMEPLMEVSVKGIEGCSKQKGSLVQRAFPRQKFPLRNNQFSNDSSSKQTKEINTSKINEENSDSDGSIERLLDSTSSDSHVNCETEKTIVADTSTKMKQVASNHNDFCKMLADCVLERGPKLEVKKNDEQTLPLKFKFEDEVPEEVEKTESEKEIEGLFAELALCLEVKVLGLRNYPEVDQPTKKDFSEETQHDRCARGEHELRLEDDQGEICIYCMHVATQPKDVMPPWAKNTRRESRRKRYSQKEQQLPEFGEFDLQSSRDNIADFRNSHPNGTVWNLKPSIRESMYEHQREGFEFLWKNIGGSIDLNELRSSTDPSGVGGCIISHAPGTGKTRLTIVFIETYLQLFPNCRPVIIAPASMLLTWEEEFRKWNVDFPFYNLSNLDLTGKENETAVGLLEGSKRQNKDAIRMVKIYSWNTGRSILGISYNLFEKLTGEKDHKRKDMRKILLEKPGLVILDEGHTPRSKRSNIWNALLKLHTEKRVVLSGTPFQNNFEELFNMLRIVRPAIAEALLQERTFAEMITSRKKYRSISEDSVEKLKESMFPFVHVHKGTILQQSLPGLKDCVVLLKPLPLQKKLIERLKGSPNTFDFEHKVALISVHPYLYKYSDSAMEQRMGIDINEVKASKLNPNLGVKTKFIVELVHISMALDEKVLIFSQYIDPLKLLKDHLKEIFNWAVGKEILMMQGKMEQKQRQYLINKFNAPKNESRVMLASTKCCSEGISLVGASRVVLLDVVWNPSVERQAISRAYRIGQKKHVYTYHLMTCGTTEADKYRRQAEKERLSELVFTSSSNESDKNKHLSTAIEDRILEKMVDHPILKEMFEKIINQPKDTDLIQSFGLTSS